MHLNKFFLVVATGLASLVTLPAHAEETGRSNRLLFGPQIGFFTPASRLVRDRFGGSWTNLGLGLGDVAAPTSKGELNFDVNLISSRAKDSEALLAPIGLVYRRGTSEEKKTRPYFGASVNFLVTNFRSNYILDNIPSGVRTGAGGSVFGGVSMGNRFYVEGRYYAFSKIRNFDFSGMNIGVGWRL